MSKRGREGGAHFVWTMLENTPLPNPPPRGGRECTAFAAASVVFMGALS